MNLRELEQEVYSMKIETKSGMTLWLCGFLRSRRILLAEDDNGNVFEVYPNDVARVLQLGSEWKEIGK